jgi:hypothetical protein
MNFIGFIILSMILCLGLTHGTDENSELIRNSHGGKQIRRNVISDDVLSSAARSVSRFLDNAEKKLVRNARSANDSSIFCNVDADCKFISSIDVCIYHPGILTGICLPKPNQNIATSTTNIKNIIYTFILSGFILLIN